MHHKTPLLISGYAVWRILCDCGVCMFKDIYFFNSIFSFLPSQKEILTEMFWNKIPQGNNPLRQLNWEKFPWGQKKKSVKIIVVLGFSALFWLGISKDIGCLRPHSRENTHTNTLQSKYVPPWSWLVTLLCVTTWPHLGPFWQAAVIWRL